MTIAVGLTVGGIVTIALIVAFLVLAARTFWRRRRLKRLRAKQQIALLKAVEKSGDLHGGHGQGARLVDGPARTGDRQRTASRHRFTIAEHAKTVDETSTLSTVSGDTVTITARTGAA